MFYQKIQSLCPLRTFISIQSRFELLPPCDHSLLLDVRFPCGEFVILPGQHIGDVLRAAAVPDTLNSAVDFFPLLTSWTEDGFFL